MNKQLPPMGSLWSMLAKPQKPGAKNLSLWNLLADPDAATPGGPYDPDRPCAVQFDERCVYWAMRNIPQKFATENFLVCGIIGSGKTTVIQLLLQSIARRFDSSRARPEQLIVFDAKGDAIPRLAALGHHPANDNFWIMNPADQRAATWNLGDAARTPLMARQIAALLVPEEKNSTAPYFANAAREITYAVILGLDEIMRCNWSLRDLLCALDSKEHILAITSRQPRAKVIVDRIFADEKHAFGALSTLGTKLGPFEQVAALWHSGRNRKRFSIPDFLSKPGVLVLGNDPALSDSLWPINAILLKALTQEILRGEETQRPRHWFLLDEFPAMKRVDCIHDLLNLGRSKGASVTLGLHGFENLAEIYGENAANIVFGQCAHKTFLRAGSPKTAEWAEKYFGKVRQVEMSESVARGGPDRIVTQQFSVQERSALMASTFLDLPLPAPGGSLASINDVPSYQTAFLNSHSFDHVLSMCVPKSSGVPAFEPHADVKDQYLQPWSDDEKKLFCGTTDDKGETPAPKPKPRRKASDLPTRRPRKPPTTSPDDSED